jgi:uncharacterized membrane protein
MSARTRKAPPASSLRRLYYALLVSNGTSLLLFVLRSAESQTDRYWFLIWNLVLAWLPLGFAWWLVRRLKTTPWMGWQNVALSLLWLGFLPNSFYMLSDLIHLHETGEVSLLYDIVMFCSFIFNAYVAGFMSLMLMHAQLLKRTTYARAFGAVSGIMLLCSFAIYLGRTLRWNTWDVLVHPAGILFDVSDRVINPILHPEALVTTGTFFLLLLSMYMVIFECVRMARPKR